MIFRQLFDRETCTYTYLLADAETREAVLIDPVLEQADRDVELLRQLDLELVYTLETHVHADHITAGSRLRERLGTRTVVSEAGGAPCADVKVNHGDRISFGRHHLEVRATPGHTSGCVSYISDDRAMAFTGDALFVRGCGRTDFQEGDAGTLYDSVHGQILSLPATTRIYPGHDYRGRTLTTVAEEQRFNPRLGGGRTREEFVAIMDALKLANPKKLHIAVPANQACGRLNEAFEVQSADVLDGDRRIIDVRSEGEFRTGHVPGAELVPLDRVMTAAMEWSRDEPIVCVCRSGVRSLKAVSVLRGLGFANATSLAGGVTGWQRAGFPVARA